MNYYNEFEPFAAEWLKELIREGLIPDGEVDTRSIVDVEPGDLKDFTQCHFFAGIGGWAYAARLAGWRDDRPMWTGSPPCQPFSVAGKQKGTDDERHLWPVWFRLVRECRPSIIFGEQVSSAIRHGWLDSLQEDLEAENYACAAAVLPASGVGALHKRDRLWIVAREVLDNSERKGSQGHRRSNDEERSGQNQDRSGSERGFSVNRSTNTVAHANDIGHQWSEGTGREAERRAEYAGNGCSRTMGDTEHSGSHGSEERRGNEEAGSGSPQGQDISLQSQGAGGCTESGDLRRVCVPLADSDNSGQRSDGGSVQQDQWDNTWGRCQAVQCKDGKVRAIPIEPEIFPLANGIPNRVGILRGAGNAIVPQVAAEIIRAFV